MSTVSYKHLDREFRTEHKLFLLTVEKGGQAVKIVERNRVKDFDLSFELGGANWLCDITLEAVQFQGKNGFLRKFRGSSYVLLATIDTNRRGRFLRLDKLQEGKLSSIYVPNGFQSNGWRELRNCLLSMLRRERMRVVSRTEGNVFDGDKYSFFGSIGEQKNWRFAVVFYRSSANESWEGVKFRLCRRLGRAVDLSTLHANRGILWCRDEKEKSHLLKSDFCKLNIVETVKVVQWSQQQHWEDIFFQGQNIWVGIEGIPLNWWNIHAIKVIGAKLGGVIEIAKETLDRSFLTYAKIRVSGFYNGFLPSILELPRGSDSVMLGIFPLYDNGASSSVGSGRTLGLAFRRGKVLRRSIVDVNAHFQRVLHEEGSNDFSKLNTVAGGGETVANTSGEVLQRRFFEGVRSVPSEA